MKSRESVLVGVLLVVLISATIALSAFLADEEDAGLLPAPSIQRAQEENSTGSSKKVDSRFSEARVATTEERSESDAPAVQTSLYTFQFISTTTDMPITGPMSWEISSTSNPNTPIVLTTDERGAATCVAALGNQEWRIKSQSPDWAALTDSFRASHQSTNKILVARLGLGRIKVVDAAYVPISGALLRLMDGVYVDYGNAPFDLGAFGIERRTDAEGLAEFETLTDPLACDINVSCDGYAPVVGRFPMAFDVRDGAPVAEVEIMLEKLPPDVSHSVRFDIRGLRTPSSWTLLVSWPLSDVPLGWSTQANLGSAPLGNAIPFPQNLSVVRVWYLSARFPGVQMSLNVTPPQETPDRQLDIVLNRLTRCTFRLPASIAGGIGIRYVDAMCSGPFLNLESEAYGGWVSDLASTSSERSTTLDLPRDAIVTVVAYLTDGRVATAKFVVPEQEITIDLEGSDSQEGTSQSIRVVCNSPLASTVNVYAPRATLQWNVVGGPHIWTVEGGAPVGTLWLKILDGLFIVVRATGEPRTITGGLDLSDIHCEEGQFRFLDTSGQVLSGLEVSLSPTSQIDHDSAAMFHWRPAGSPGYEMRVQTGPRFRTGADGVATVRLPIGEYRVSVSGSSGGHRVYPRREVVRPVGRIVRITPGNNSMDIVVDQLREISVQVRAADGRSLDAMHWSLFGARSGDRRNFYGSRGTFRWTEEPADLRVSAEFLDKDVPIHLPEGTDSMTLHVTIP